MIYVTVGTDNHDFSRLIKEADSVAKKTKDKIIMQIGHTKHEPKNCEWFRFTSSERIENLYKTADIIITHGGAGSIINSLKYGKIPIVIPRLKKFDEHVNDHQLDLVRALEKRGKVVAIYNIKDLENGLEKIKGFKIAKKIKEKLKIISILEGYIKEEKLV